MNEVEPFRRLLIVALAALFPVMLYHRIKAHRPEPLDRRQEGLLVLATLRPIGLTFMACLILYLVNPARMAWSEFPLPAWARWTGLGLMPACFVLLLWTLRTLGTNLTDTVVTRRQHTLVVRGPYRWVRHPFYCAVGLMILAASLVAANWFLMTTGALALAIMVIRTPTEEAKLVERFGDDYRTYMARTNRFVPTLRPRV